MTIVPGVKPADVAKASQKEFWLTAQRLVAVMMQMDDVEQWMSIRQALLLLVDIIERNLGTSPRTADLRKRNK